jgi:hypothetical protein
MITIRPRRISELMSGMLLAGALSLLPFAEFALGADEPPSPAGAKSTDASAAGSRSPASKSAAEPAGTPRIEGGQVSGRWREGSRLIDQVGFFKVTGDHVTFISSDGKLKFDGLENLAIERIARTIGDSPDQLEWSTSGTITEYRGANYLLVTQAVLKTKAARQRRTP